MPRLRSTVAAWRAASPWAACAGAGAVSARCPFLCWPPKVMHVEAMSIHPNDVLSLKAKKRSRGCAFSLIHQMHHIHTSHTSQMIYIIYELMTE
jgi:hypothetical protein